MTCKRSFFAVKAAECLVLAKALGWNGELENQGAAVDTASHE